MAEILSTLSAGGDKGTPTNGGDRYVSMATWESDQVTDLVSGGNTAVLECYSDDPFPGTNGYLDETVLVDWGATTTSPTNNITIRAAAGSECLGVRRFDGGTGFGITTAGTTTCVELRASVVFENIEVYASNATSNTAMNVSSGNQAAEVTLTGCVFSATGQNVKQTVNLTGANAIHNIYNCIVHVINDGWGISYSNGNSTAAGGTFAYITVRRQGTAFDPGIITSFNGTNTIYNCVVYGFGDDYSSSTTPATGSNCAGGDNTVISEGYGTIVGVTDADFVNAPADMNAAASGLLDLAGTPVAGITTDIAGNPRSATTPTIGAFEIVGAAPGVSFDGPNIIAQSGVQNDPFSFDDNLEGTVASRFTGATSYAYAPGSDQPAGITINATTGNPEGTPSVSGTFDITIEGSD